MLFGPGTWSHPRSGPGSAARTLLLVYHGPYFARLLLIHHLHLHLLLLSDRRLPRSPGRPLARPLGSCARLPDVCRRPARGSTSGSPAYPDCFGQT